jgi:hypothetical protein
MPLQLGRWNGRRSVLNLGMAIRAQKDALLRLSTECFERKGNTLRVEFEPLIGWLDVMKVQGSHVASVSTDTAGSPGLLHEDRLHLPSSSRNGGRSAPPAAIAAATVQAELRLTVARTLRGHRCEARVLGRSSLASRPAPRTVDRLQTEPGQPVSDSRLTAIDGLRDLSDRRSRSHKLLQVLLAKPPRAKCRSRFAA